jgi:hypothetical protein
MDSCTTIRHMWDEKLIKKSIYSQELELNLLIVKVYKNMVQRSLQALGKSYRKRPLKPFLLRKKMNQEIMKGPASSKLLAIPTMCRTSSVSWSRNIWYHKAIYRDETSSAQACQDQHNLLLWVGKEGIKRNAASELSKKQPPSVVILWICIMMKFSNLNDQN